MFDAKSKEIDLKGFNSDEATKNLKNLLDQEKLLSKQNLEKLEQEKKTLLSENNSRKKEIDQLNNALNTKVLEIEGGKKELENLNNLLNSLPKVVPDEKIPVKVGAGVVVGLIIGALALKLLKK